MKPPPSPQPEPPLLHTKSPDADGIQDNISTDHVGLTASSPTAENESVKKLLTEIRDLLQTQVHEEEEQSYKEKKKDKVSEDWKLTAAVVDRICAIVYTVVFIAGTLAFIIVVTRHQSSLDSQS